MVWRSLKRILVLAAVSILVLWAAYQWVWPIVANPFIELAVLKQETLTDQTAVEALVVRSETVVRAPSDGVLQPDTCSGERVSRGTRMGAVLGPSAGTPVFAPHAGLVFWNVDGLEEVLQPGSVLASGSVPVVSPAEPLAEGAVAKGEPLCRVVDNLSPVLLHFNVPPGVLPQSMLKEGERWRVLLNGEESRGRVTLILTDNGVSRVELALSRYPETLMQERRVRCAVITREVSGFIVPRAALVLHSGMTGIYLLRKDRIEWRPVRVEAQLGENVQISGEALTEGGLYVVNPWLAADGRRYLRNQ